MENILLNAEFYELTLPVMDQVQIPPTEEDNKEVENNNEYQNEVYTTPVQNKQNHVFAVPKIYNCMYCEKRFYTQKAIRKHQLNHAKQQLRCTSCGMRSHNIGNLHRHCKYFHHVSHKQNTDTRQAQE